MSWCLHPWTPGSECRANPRSGARRFHRLASWWDPEQPSPNHVRSYPLCRDLPTGRSSPAFRWEASAWVLLELRPVHLFRRRLDRHLGHRLALVPQRRHRLHLLHLLQDRLAAPPGPERQRSLAPQPRPQAKLPGSRSNSNEFSSLKLLSLYPFQLHACPTESIRYTACCQARKCRFISSLIGLWSSLPELEYPCR